MSIISVPSKSISVFLSPSSANTRTINQKEQEKIDDLPFVSGMNKITSTQRITHHAAYQPNAPWTVNAVRKEGNVKATIKLKHQVVAVAQDMPTSRIWVGKASAL